MEAIIQYLQNRESLGIKLGLERMDLLLDRLNHPEKEIPMIHVAGTNGKGSTVHMLANTLIAQGYKVGVFTSPSFYGIRGHVFRNNQIMDEKTFIQLMNEILPVVNELDRLGQKPTSFEILTALAFLFFKGRVDLAIVEAGMGGRFDTTNCITPLISVITTIAIDHEEYLGNSLSEISYHKAGIIKKNRPVVIGPMEEEAKKVIIKEAEEKNAKLFSFGEDFNIEMQDNRPYWIGPNGFSNELTLQIEGKHQLQNAAVALMVLYNLREKNVINIDWKRVNDSLYQVKIPGRFEMIKTHPNIILDSAHNFAGIDAFIHTAKPYFKANRQRVLFAGFKDKRLYEMIERLQSENIQITLTTFEHTRAAKKDYYKELLIKFDNITFADDWKKVITTFIEQSSQSETLFVTGSLHFTMVVRQFITQYYQKKSNGK